MKNNKSFLFLLSIIVIFCILFILHIPIECVFLKYLHIKCPGCGLTRSFDAIMHFNLISAFHYNILGIPIFIFMIYSIIRLVIDSIKNEYNYLNSLECFCSRHYKLILFVIIINGIYNNIK